LEKKIGIVDAVTLVVTYIDNSGMFAEVFSSGDLSGMAAANAAGAQISSAIVWVFPTTLNNIAGINAVTGFVVAVKVADDVAAGKRCLLEMLSV
jgi:hypothetical protein